MNMLDANEMNEKKIIVEKKNGCQHIFSVNFRWQNYFIATFFNSRCVWMRRNFVFIEFSNAWLHEQDHIYLGWVRATDLIRAHASDRNNIPMEIFGKECL